MKTTIYFLVLFLAGCVPAFAQTSIKGIGNSYLVEVPTIISSAASFTPLTISNANTNVIVVGTLPHTISLPTAASSSTMPAGRSFNITNESTQSVIVNDYNGGLLKNLLAGGSAKFLLKTPGTTSGSWSVSAGGSGIVDLVPGSISGVLPVVNGGTGLSTPASVGGFLPITTSGGGYSLAQLTPGTGISINNASGAITINGTAQGVTEVALTTPSHFDVTGSPITSSGTLAISYVSQASNLVLAGPPTGASAPPTYRSLGTADIPQISLVSGVSGTLSMISGGTNANLVASAGSVAYSSGAAIALSNVGTAGMPFISSGSTTPPGFGRLDISSATNVVGTVSGANGGTGLSTVATGDILIASGTNAYSRLAVGTTGQLLTVSSAGTPYWGPGALTNPTTASGSILYASAVGAGVGVLSELAIGASSTVLTVSSSGFPVWISSTVPLTKSISFGAGGSQSAPSNCTSTPCTIYKQTRGDCYTSVVRNSTGSYSPQFNCFATTPICTYSFTNWNSGTTSCVINQAAASSTAVTVVTYCNNNPVDAALNITCSEP